MNTRAKGQKCGDMPAQNSQPIFPEPVDMAEVRMEVEDVSQPVEILMFSCFKCTQRNCKALRRGGQVFLKITSRAVTRHTTVNGLSWYVHKDPQLWTDPDTFLPERFLQENGTLNQVALSNVIPFSVGKRACPGEQLARMMVLIFFASIMQSFDIVGEAGKEHCTVPVNGFILTPPPYLMRAIPRS
ncbi:hypothetical protein BV898_02548 [Hypsibius exemplaris]|uniref:Uncharacterized protein n=1 Tax=Hypsibius exemplaris TaxID=2072580 RepID=A0A1W0X794_HYPEX|nr:hypothetical protein BV898_02548 [Hypsibius exemplaris]